MSTEILQRQSVILAIHDAVTLMRRLRSGGEAFTYAETSGGVEVHWIERIALRRRERTIDPPIESPPVRGDLDAALSACRGSFAAGIIAIMEARRA